MQLMVGQEVSRLPHWGTEAVGQAARGGKVFLLVLSYSDEALGLLILVPPAAGTKVVCEHSSLPRSA